MRSVDLERNSFAHFFIGILVRLTTMYLGLTVWSTCVVAQDVLPTTLYPAGMRQVEYIDATDGGRPLDYMLVYPAATDAAATPFKVFLSTNLHLYKDARIAADGLKHPLVMFSHGAGGNGSGYAWLGEYLASHGWSQWHITIGPTHSTRVHSTCAKQAVAATAGSQSRDHASPRGQGLGATHRPQSDWRCGPFARGIYRPLDRRSPG